MNEYQEILERILKNIKRYGKLNYDFSVIQKLIKKAMPTLPSYEGDGYSDGNIVFDTWICPTTVGETVMISGFVGCDNCYWDSEDGLMVTVLRLQENDYAAYAKGDFYRDGYKGWRKK